MSRTLTISPLARLAAALFLAWGLSACQGAHEAASEVHDAADAAHDEAHDAAAEAHDEAHEADAEGMEAETFGLMNESHPETDLVFAGQITPEQVEALAAAGYATVVDIRGLDEDRGMDEQQVVEAAGLEYVQVPVTGETMDDEATYERFFDVLENRKRPMLVHCGSSNRVGAMYAAYLGSEHGVPVEEALETGREAGLSSPELEERIRARLEAGDTE